MIMKILLTDGTLKEVNGHNLQEFDKYGFKLFYYKNDDNKFVISEASTGASLTIQKALSFAKGKMHSELTKQNGIQKDKLKRLIKEHFNQKYYHGKKITMLNNTAGGMFKESKV